MLLWLKRHCPLFLKNHLKYFLFLRYKIKEALSLSKRVYYCPCCGIRLSHFIDGGYNKHYNAINPKRYEHIRQDVICPACGSLPRHRILASWCQNNLNILTNNKNKILYFSLETSMMLWFKRKGISVTSADLFHPADLKLDIEHIDQPDASWDLIFCNHVLEHVPDYKKALGELRRILAPGGKLVCSFPIDPNYATVYEDMSLVHDSSPDADRERIRRFGQIDHLRVFGRDSKQLLEMAGFRVFVIDGDTMPEEICPVVGPADYDSNILFVCEK